MISSNRVYDENCVHPAYLLLWYMYLFLISMLGVILVVKIVQKGSKKRKSNLTGNKTKKRNAKKYDDRKQMEDFIDNNRSNARAYYIRQCNRVKNKARIAYKISKKYKIASAKAYSKMFHALNPGYILQKCKNWYNKNKDSKVKKSIDYSKKCYINNPAPKRSMALEYIVTFRLTIIITFFYSINTRHIINNPCYITAAICINRDCNRTI